MSGRSTASTALDEALDAGCAPPWPLTALIREVPLPSSGNIMNGVGEQKPCDVQDVQSSASGVR